MSLRYAYLRCSFGKQCNCLAEIVGVAVLKHQLLLVVVAGLVAAWRPSLHLSCKSLLCQFPVFGFCAGFWLDRSSNCKRIRAAAAHGGLRLVNALTGDLQLCCR